MKKIFLLLLLSFVSVHFYPQLSDIFLCDEDVKNLYPTIEQIKVRYQGEVEKSTPPRGNRIKGFHEKVGQIELKEEDIDSMRPIVHIKVYPDTINESGILYTEMMTDKIYLYNKGYSHPWSINTSRRSLITYGGKQTVMIYKDIIDKIPADECIFLVYFLRYDRYWTPLLAYKKEGKYTILDRNGNEFDSLYELVNHLYGSMGDYIDAYKKAYTPQSHYIDKSKLKPLVNDLPSNQ